MNRNDPDIRSQLCGEYVLGTLSPRVRRRFERWLSEDTALALQVRDWRERLEPLYEMVPEQRPPERVWQAVCADIGADTAAGAIKVLALSVEPPGGSPTGAPTGPITHQGAWLVST
jgi:anti-sigma-K factor RskA